MSGAWFREFLACPNRGRDLPPGGIDDSSPAAVLLGHAHATPFVAEKIPV